MDENKKTQTQTQTKTRNLNENENNRKQIKRFGFLEHVKIHLAVIILVVAKGKLKNVKT